MLGQICGRKKSTAGCTGLPRIWGLGTGPPITNLMDCSAVQPHFHFVHLRKIKLGYLWWSRFALGLAVDVDESLDDSEAEWNSTGSAGLAAAGSGMMMDCWWGWKAKNFQSCSAFSFFKLSKCTAGSCNGSWPPRARGVCGLQPAMTRIGPRWNHLCHPCCRDVWIEVGLDGDPAVYEVLDSVAVATTMTIMSTSNRELCNGCHY